jgi:septal ring factor EnvC (AmiA/AmiB activator)
MEKDLEDYPRWRDSVEARLSTLDTADETLKADLKTQAGLRAAMDKDMGTLSAKFGAQERLIQAIAQTQSEHTALLRGHTAVLRDHTERLTRLEVGQEGLKAKLDRVHVGVEAIHTLLTGLTAVDDDPDALPRFRNGP